MCVSPACAKPWHVVRHRGQCKYTSVSLWFWIACCVFRNAYNEYMRISEFVAVILTNAQYLTIQNTHWPDTRSRLFPRTANVVLQLSHSAIAHTHALVFEPTHAPWRDRVLSVSAVLTFSDLTSWIELLNGHSRRLISLTQPMSCFSSRTAPLHTRTPLSSGQRGSGK